MNTKQIIILVLLLSVYILSAQTAAKPATVHIKTKVVKDGVTTVKDTTFQATGAINVIRMSDSKNVSSLFTDSILSNSMPQFLAKILRDSLKPGSIPAGFKASAGNLDFTVDSLVKEAGLKGEPKIGGQYMIKNVRCNATTDEINNTKEFIMITIDKRVDISEASEQELKQLNNQTGVAYQKLELSKLNFYPNPGNGKFTLSFTSPKKADTDITIQNSEGKLIYQEKLPALSGSYTKEIDISQNPKGIYFIKIAQGTSAQIRKLVIE